MIYTTNQKEYHFVFSAMLVYGAYQMIEFSVLHHIGEVAYALLGLFFLVLPTFIKNEYGLTKIFPYPSALVPILRFIFITVQGLLFRLINPSFFLFLVYILILFILFLAYRLIAVNFIYLSNLSNIKKQFFYYLSSVFLMTALFEAVRLGEVILPYESLALPMFIAAFLFYLIFGCFMKLAYLKVIKTSARDVSFFVMGLCMLANVASNNWWRLGVMFLFISLLAIIMERFEPRVTVLPKWMHPLALGLTVTMFYTASESNGFWYDYFGPLEPMALILASITVLIA